VEVETCFDDGQGFVEEEAYGFLEEDYVTCVDPFVQCVDFENQPLNARMNCFYYGFFVDLLTFYKILILLEN
jgi:hypothetical protein